MKTNGSEDTGKVFIEAKCPHCGTLDRTHFRFMEYAQAIGAQRTVAYKCGACSGEFTIHMIVTAVDFHSTRVTRFGGQICFEFPTPKPSKLQSLRRLPKLP